jgi:L-ribulose-5-phosphate 3-epimerase
VKHRIGIMQGRLSPRPPGKLQAFPWQSWQAEFDSAAHLGFDHIEWIFEVERAFENPIWTAEGRRAIQAVVAASGVRVRSVCADYFMVRRLAGDGEAQVRDNVGVLCELIEKASELGVERMLLPLLETSAVSTPELEAEVSESLRRAAPKAAEHGIVLGLEMEIAGREYAKLIDGVAHPNVRAYYDVGNSTAQGFDVASDVEPLLTHLFAVHVKDRKYAGGSQILGQGDTNFSGFFRRLQRAGFGGDFLLQHFFEKEPEVTAARALAFVRDGLLRASEAAA